MDRKRILQFHYEFTLLGTNSSNSAIADKVIIRKFKKMYIKDKKGVDFRITMLVVKVQESYLLAFPLGMRSLLFGGLAGGTDDDDGEDGTGTRSDMEDLKCLQSLLPSLMLELFLALNTINSALVRLLLSLLC